MARSINKNLKSSISIEVSSFNPAQRKPVAPKLEYKDQYLTFKALEDTVFKLSANYISNDSIFSYSVDNGKTWTTKNINTDITVITSPLVVKGSTILWKGCFTRTANLISGITFSSTNKYDVCGNIMSLLYNDDFKNKTEFSNNSLYIFKELFSNSTNLISAKNLILPAITLTEGCYQRMFSNCTSLVIGPVISANLLNRYSCRWMFSNCTSLTAAPSLPAMILGDNCYEYMFLGCTSLTTAPSLPATELASCCYMGMFYDCTSLTTAPSLPAIQLPASCYFSMFYNCISLETAPILPAINLSAGGCYSQMFYGCTKLNYVKALFTTSISLSKYMTNWLTNVSSTGTFVKNINANWNNTDVNIIPEGWTVETASE